METTETKEKSINKNASKKDQEVVNSLLDIISC